ncbi:MAG: HlyD family efflux transporter periplasmic adaptor subunit [Planctomycetaceae bacterium]|nr:HlyD family efflux transporter periplasmic adaptor subunit [Planctomycetaceae bacterium]
MADRAIDPQQCRGSLIDVLIRGQKLLGAAWFNTGGESPRLLVDRLATPALEIATVRPWLESQLASLAGNESSVTISECPHVRQLSAIFVPVDPFADGTEVLVALVVNGKPSVGIEAVFSAQALGQEWNRWVARRLTQIRTSQLQETAAVLELVQRLDACPTLREASQTLCDSFVESLRCQFVAVGLTKEGSAISRLVAISGLSDFDTRSPQVRILESALNDSGERNAISQFPTLDGSSGNPLALKRLSEVMGVEAILAISFWDRDTRIGSLVCGGAATDLFLGSIERLLRVAAPSIATSLRSVARGEGRPWRQNSSDSRRRRMLAQGAIASGVTLLLAGILMLPMSYRLSCHCEVEPTTRRVSLAPYDGLLETTFAEPGDLVREGELLARMETRDIEWELAGIEAEKQRAAKERDTHSAGHEVAKSILSELELQRLQTREALLKFQLENMEIRSPIDGVILTGSLDRREHSPVTIGQALYEISPLESVRIEVAIPAAEIPHVRTGMSVSILIDGQPETPLRGTVQRISPLSEIRNDRNVFVAEVTIVNTEDRLRPGMEGTAKITSDPHPIAWNLFHRPWEVLKTTFWF